MGYKFSSGEENKAEHLMLCQLLNYNFFHCHCQVVNANGKGFLDFSFFLSL